METRASVREALVEPGDPQAKIPFFVVPETSPTLRKRFRTLTDGNRIKQHLKNIPRPPGGNIPGPKCIQKTVEHSNFRKTVGICPTVPLNQWNMDTLGVPYPLLGYMLSIWGGIIEGSGPGRAQEIFAV